MSDEVHSEFGVKKKKKVVAKKADTPVDAPAVVVAAAPVEPAAPAPEAAHPEFGVKKGKTPKPAPVEAASVATAPAVVAVVAPTPPVASATSEPAVPTDDLSTSSGKKKGVSFHPEVPEESTASKSGKGDGSDGEAAAGAVMSLPELDASIPKFRFYERDFPEQDEFVVVRVQSIEEMGAYVTLLEYDNIQGMVLLSELSRRRIRSIHKLLRVGRNEIVMVIRGDKDQRCIDLSKRRVTPEDRDKCEDRFKKASMVQSVMGHMASVLKVPIEDLCERISFPLYRKYGHAYEAFKRAETNPDEVLAGLTISDDERALLLKKIKHSLTPQPLNIRADVNVTCFEYEGIEAVKAALLAGRAVSTPTQKVSVRNIASPTYVLMTTTLDSAQGIALLESAIAAIEKEIKKHKGAIKIITKPTVTSHQDEAFGGLEGDDDDEVDAADV